MGSLFWVSRGLIFSQKMISTETRFAIKAISWLLIGTSQKFLLSHCGSRNYDFSITTHTYIYLYIGRGNQRQISSDE
jgi:hypothetical protein